MSYISLFSFTIDLVTILPVIAVSLVIIVISLKLFYKIRAKLPKIVNCWFCNRNTSVPYVYRNSWKCPNCDQYNGFTPDGDYNRVIFAQYNINLNKPLNLSPPKKQTPSINGLCKFCNINQELKMAQLAAFVPIEPTNFDEEVEIYREQLDKAYQLCVKCENVLSDKLSRQKSWLKSLYADLERFLNHKSIINNQIKLRRFVYAYASAILSLGIIICASSYFQLSNEIKNSAVSYMKLMASNYPIEQLSFLPDLHLKLDSFIALCTWIDVENSLIALNGLNTFVQLLEAVEQNDKSARLNVAGWFILFLMSAVSDHNFGLFAVVEMFVGGVSLVSSVLYIRALKLIKLQAPLINYKSSLEKPVHTVQPLSETRPKKTKSQTCSPATPKPQTCSPPTPKPQTCSPVIPHTHSTKSLPSQTPPIDFGLGKLNIGAKRSLHKTNSLFESRTYGSKVQNHLFRPVLSPPKLSIDHLYEAQTPSSSSSSGVFSSASQRGQTPSVVGDFNSHAVDDFDPHDVCSLRSYPQSSYNASYDPMYPTSPYIFTQYHRTYHPVPTPALLNSYYSTNNTERKQKNTFTLPKVLIIPIALSVLTNIAVLWIQLYNQLVVK